MVIKRKRGWEMRESEATPEAMFRDRRRIVQAMGMGALIAAAAPTGAALAAAPAADPSAGLYPVKRNERYTLDRPVTDEKLSTTYNNFYEYGSTKDHRRGRAATADSAVERDHRRHGREADDASTSTIS